MKGENNMKKLLKNKSLKNKSAWLIPGLLLVLSCISLVWALMTKSTPKITNEFTLAEVTCQIHENVEKMDGSSDTTDSTLHTGIVKKNDITVENTSNISAYIRVRLVSYYVDENNNIIGKDCPVPTFVPNSSYWISDSTNNTYYYKNPVAAGAKTEDLITPGSSIVLKKVDGTASDSYEYLYQVVDVIAEAVQAQPSNAVSNVWNVSVGTDGILSK